MPIGFSDVNICAIATASGRGGVGIVRVSGQALLSFAQVISGGRTPIPRHAMATDFLDVDGAAIDNGLLLYFPAPHSFTGEDVVELHGHGGPIVMKLLLNRCVELGARLAEPGEFTKRSFLNGKLDLAQAESVADLIEAASEAAAKSALKSLKGVFSNKIHQLTEELTSLRTLVEASLDFPEEGIDFLTEASAFSRLEQVCRTLAQVEASACQGAILRDGVHVTLVGPPNVGKSSLLNALAGDEVAIVTEVPGTTRDTVREVIIIDGVPVHIVDTAGLRDTVDLVEQIGIERTWQAIERADVALVLIDSREGISVEVQSIVDRLPPSLPRIMLFNKIDLSGFAPAVTKQDGQLLVYLSAYTHAGIDLLKAQLLELIGFSRSLEEGVFLARERHVDAIRRAADHVARASQDWQQVEIVAEELRMAQLALSAITGEFSSDDLLGTIFSRFCIGK